MHAHACENLLTHLDAANDTEGGAVLDVGSGSGYCESPVCSIASRSRLVSRPCLHTYLTFTRNTPSLVQRDTFLLPACSSPGLAHALHSWLNPSPGTPSTLAPLSSASCPLDICDDHRPPFPFRHTFLWFCFFLGLSVTAVLHRLAPRATVIGIDHLQGLADLARTNLAKDGVTIGPASKIDIVCGDGRKGWPAHGK